MLEKQLTWTGWPSFAVMFIAGSAAILSALIPDLHTLTFELNFPKRIVCHRHAADTEFVLGCAVEELRKIVPTPVEYFIIEEGWTLNDYVARTRHLWETYRRGEIPALPEVNPDKLERIELTWFQGQGLVIGYAYSDMLNSAKRFDYAKVDLLYPEGIPGTIVPFPISKDPATNFHHAQVLLEQIVGANQRAWPHLSIEELMAATRLAATDHLGNLWKSRGSMLRIMVGLITVTMVIAGYAKAVKATMTKVWKTYQHFARRGHPVSRPSLPKALTLLASYEVLYEKHVSHEVSERGRVIHRERKRQKKEVATADAEGQKRAAFQLVFEEVRSRVASMSSVPSSVHDHIRQAADDGLSTDERRYALGMANSALSVHLHKRHGEREREEQRSSGKSTTKPTGPHKPKRRSRLEAPHLAIVEHEAEPDHFGRSAVITYEELIRLLDVEDHLPEDIDALHVSVLIVAGLIRPGNRGGSYWGMSYSPSQKVRERTERRFKRLDKPFDPRLYEDALDWLIKNGVVIYHAKKKSQGAPPLSLRVNESETTNAGRPVLVQVKRFAGEIVVPLSA